MCGDGVALSLANAWADAVWVPLAEAGPEGELYTVDLLNMAGIEPLQLGTPGVVGSTETVGSTDSPFSPALSGWSSSI